ERGRRRASAAGLHQLARRADVYLPRVQARPHYTDTNLSNENCYVLTGDLGAIPGGVANPGNNPFGLRSGLCGATQPRWVRSANASSSIASAAGSGPAASQLKMQSGSFGC